MLSLLVPRHAVMRFAVAMFAGAAAYAAASFRLPRMAAALIGWDAAGLVLLTLAWAVIAGADAGATRARAGAEDPGRTVVYVVVLLTSAASLLAGTVLVRDARCLGAGLRDAFIILCLLTVALAWAMTHTAFTLRYAHLFYREDDEGVGGVTFPGESPPTYLDFAYFAFTIGMCFQVSDVCVTSPQIRRSLLLHALLSFAYNSVILAFVLNLVFTTAA